MADPRTSYDDLAKDEKLNKMIGDIKIEKPDSIPWDEFEKIMGRVAEIFEEKEAGREPEVTDPETEAFFAKRKDREPQN